MFKNKKIKTAERRRFVYLEHIPFPGISIVDFEQVTNC